MTNSINVNNTLKEKIMSRTPDKDTIKRIFGKKDIAEQYLKETQPQYFRLKSKRNRKERFLLIDKDVYDCIQSHWDPNDVLPWTRNYAVSSNGKYNQYHKNPAHASKLSHEIKNEINKLNSQLASPIMINPEKFSNEHIKPLARKQVSYFMENGMYDSKLSKRDYIVTALIAFEAQKLRQHKNDLAEYNLLQAEPTLFPTLSHRRGADLFKLENGEIVPLDIKTTRWPKFFYDGITHEEAAILLYQKQGEEWFSADSRTYLISPSDSLLDLPAPASCLPVDQQLNRKFTVEFAAERGKKKAIEKYGTDTFTVPNVRVVFL